MTGTADLPRRDTGECLERQAIVFRLADGRFAVDVASVAEVGRIPTLTRVPGMPAWLPGVVNWRGRVLPVLDLREALGAASTGLGPAARLLVLTESGVTAGLLVDKVDGTTTFDGDMTDFPAPLTGPAAGLIAGQFPRPDGPVAVLDPGGLMRLREALPHGRRCA